MLDDTYLVQGDCRVRRRDAKLEFTGRRVDVGRPNEHVEVVAVVRERGVSCRKHKSAPDNIFNHRVEGGCRPVTRIDEHEVVRYAVIGGSASTVGQGPGKGHREVSRADFVTVGGCGCAGRSSEEARLAAGNCRAWLRASFFVIEEHVEAEALAVVLICGAGLDID